MSFLSHTLSLEEDEIKKDMEGLNIFESSINNAVQKEVKEEMESIDYSQDNEDIKEEGHEYE